MSEFVLKQRGQDDEESLARSAFRVGMFLYGYCGGLFGRDSYGEKEIVGLHGNTIIVKEKDGSTHSGTVEGVFKWKYLLISSNNDCDNPDYRG